MEKSEFREEFEERLELGIDWDAFAAPSVKVRAIGLTLPSELGVLWTPWHVGGTRIAALRGVEPLAVLEVARQPHLAGAQAEAVTGCRVDPNEAWRVPAVAVTRGRYLLLADAHRLVAAAILRARLTVTLLVVIAPAGIAVVPDLPHFE